MKSIREQENELFLEWKNLFHNDYFIADGVVDEDAWNSSAIKVIYLLKEVNGADEEWDERCYLCEYASGTVTRSQTIDIIIRWQYGILHGSKVVWDKVKSETAKAEVQKAMLAHICLVNMKKTAGSASVDQKKFDEYFSDFTNIVNIRRQLAIYKPDIVICGGASGYLCKIMGWKNSVWKHTSRGINYCKYNNTIYIDFWHPNNRGVSRSVLYYTLLDAIEEIYNTD